MELILLSALLTVSPFAASGAASEQHPLQQSPSNSHPNASPKLPSTPLLDLHRSLVEIDSTTYSEQSAGHYLVSHLKSLNLTVDIHPLPSTSRDASPFPVQSSGKKKKPRFNIHAYPPNHRRTHTLLTSHIDTVPPYYNYTLRSPSHSHPHENATAATEIWGRGTVDDKACIAAQITAFTSLRASNSIHPSDVGLLFVVGEETGGDGMRAANAMNLSWDAVIFGEPTEGKLAAGHKGLLQFDIHVEGKSAHSGYPWLGRSANEVMIAALGGLEGLKGKSEAEGGLPRSEKYGDTTVNVGEMHGGVASNVIAERAEAKVAGRLAGGTVKEAREICEDAIHNATEHLLEDGKARLKIVWTAEGYAPVDIDADVEGFEIITVNYGTDVPNLEGGHKRYLYGPGSILVAHSDHEHLTVGELERSVTDYERIVTAALGK